MKNKHKKAKIGDKIYFNQSLSVNQIQESHLPPFTPLDRKVYLTGFTKAVLKVVCRIPIGEVRSYEWVASQIGRPKARRAVGQALKRNPYPILVPCHRVIRANGKIGGYSRGIRNKKKLLVIEKEIAKILEKKGEFKNG